MGSSCARRDCKKTQPFLGLAQFFVSLCLLFGVKNEVFYLCTEEARGL